jgi:thioredoxin-like negative regulator of GroEL
MKCNRAVRVLRIVGVLSLASPIFNQFVYASESQGVEQIHERDFATVVLGASHEQPAVVEFYSESCGPCREFEPIIEQMAAKYKNKLRFYRIQLDELSRRQYEVGDQHSLSARLHVHAVPTVIFVDKSRQVARFEGVRRLADFDEICASHVSKRENRREP